VSGKAKKRLSKVYYIAPNGIKIELKDYGPASFYTQEQIRTEFATAFQVPKDMLFPDKKLVDVTIHEPRMNIALTDELKAKGSVEITFKYNEVNK
jgi:alpha-D-ribose 1-methylphosphonate 5-triphosphate synthase subunit PhnL